MSNLSSIRWTSSWYTYTLLLNRHSLIFFFLCSRGSSLRQLCPIPPLQSRWMLVYSGLINGLSRSSSVIGHMTYTLSYWGHKCKSLNCNWDACLHPFPESHDGSLSLWGLTSGFHRQWPQRTVVTHPQLVGSVTCRGRGGSYGKQGPLIQHTVTAARAITATYRIWAHF